MNPNSVSSFDKMSIGENLVNYMAYYILWGQSELQSMALNFSPRVTKLLVPGKVSHRSTGLAQNGNPKSRLVSLLCMQKFPPNNFNYNRFCSDNKQMLILFK